MSVQECQPMWVKLTFNSNGTFQGKEEFIEDLKGICVVQVREQWYPAACTGFEFLAEILINEDVTDFIKNVIVAGATWDVLKSMCSKIWDAFKKFVQDNEEFDLQKLTLSFNDATIVIHGVLEDQKGFLMGLYQCLPDHWIKLKEMGVDNIIKIELPYLPKLRDDLQDYFNDCEKQTPENCLWLISYQLGLESCYYSPAQQKLL